MYIHSIHSLTYSMKSVANTTQPSWKAYLPLYNSSEEVNIK